ncbi:MAG: RsmB/NOP family class I SAM-dependent RNA methyltransferase [Hyphomicrobium sp.]
MVVLQKNTPINKKLHSGFEARQAAVEALWGIMQTEHFLEDVLRDIFNQKRWKNLQLRDRAFVRLIVMTVLRRRGEIECILKSHLKKELPKKCGYVKQILLSGAAQLLFLDTPPHAAISLAVEQCKCDRDSSYFDRLVNAVLRRVAEQGKTPYSNEEGIALNIPTHFRERWSNFYGEYLSNEIANACLKEPALDLTVKSDPELWAQRLHGCVLPNGTVRLKNVGPVSELDGYSEGQWWVQDTAAALPAKLMRIAEGMRVADLCAAPGGKTAQLSAFGAKVVAVDISAARLEKLKDNLDRLKLKADLICTNAATWQPSSLLDAVLLDAPCSATGTIRRHPDILFKHNQGRLQKHIVDQALLLGQASKLVRLGGTLIYSTCSLEKEEGETQIENFLKKNLNYKRDPIVSSEIGELSEAITPNGEMRTLPCYSFKGGQESEGMDGFFAARLQRIS